MWKHFRIKYCKLSYDTSDTYNEKSNTSNFITPTAALIHISHVLRALQLHPLSEPLLRDSADAAKVTKVIIKRLEQSFFTVPPPALCFREPSVCDFFLRTAGAAPCFTKPRFLSFFNWCGLSASINSVCVSVFVCVSVGYLKLSLF